MLHEMQTRVDLSISYNDIMLDDILYTCNLEQA